MFESIHAPLLLAVCKFLFRRSSEVALAQAQWSWLLIKVVRVALFEASALRNQILQEQSSGRTEHVKFTYATSEVLSCVDHANLFDIFTCTFTGKMNCVHLIPFERLYDVTAVYVFYKDARFASYEVTVQT